MIDSEDIQDLSRSIRATLISVNENDRNMESANVVDGLFEIARSLDRVAQAIAQAPTPTKEPL
jgi:hypothetical protein